MEGFNIMDILNGTTTAAATVEAFKDVKLNYQSIITTKHNKYSMEEIGELATGIHMAGELQQRLFWGRSAKNTGLYLDTEGLKQSKCW